MNLSEIRKEIDFIDETIINLLYKRFNLTLLAGKEKKKLQLETFDKRRETEILERIEKLSSRIKVRNNFFSKLFKLIIAESKRHQKKYAG